MRENTSRRIASITGNMKAINFIDLFAGIGGLRLAFENAGCRCVFSSEWNEFSKKTYEANFHEVPAGDITKISADDIPDHDILSAGFPCQPFSIAGISKKNSLGRPTGFEDLTQGTLFFDVCRIMAKKQPRAFLLENVRNLLTHNKGKTFEVIKSSLENLGYKIFYRIFDGQFFVPQHRERIVIVGFKDYSGDFELDIEIPEHKPVMRDILENDVSEKYTLSDKLWNYLQDYAQKHRAKGNGFGYGIADLNGISRTLSARYYKDGSEILIEQENKNPRRLTPTECAKLMGFPDDFVIPVSDTQAYRQFGNSVIVPLMSEIAKLIVRRLNEIDK